MSPTLERCPSCGYWLRGLPPIWTCPECGFDYDAHAKIVRLTPRRRALKQVVLGVLLLALFFWNGIKHGPIDEGWFWTVGVVGVLTLGYFLVYCRRTGEPSRLLLTRRGVRFEAPDLDHGWIEWSRIRHAKYRWWSGRLCVTRVDGTRILTAGYERLGSPTMARECAEAINDRLRCYCPDRASPA